MTTVEEFVVNGPELSEPIPNISLGKEIFDSLCQEHGNTVAMVDAFTGEKLSYKKLLQQTLDLAEVLRRLGYHKDTVISVSGENSLEFFVPVIAALYNASIVATLNPVYTAIELRHTLNISQPKVIFCSPTACEKFVQLKHELKFIEEVVVLNSSAKFQGAQTLKEFVQHVVGRQSVSPYSFKPYHVDPENHPAYILCSSGTTGLPKGVVLSHKNVLVRNIHSRDPRYFDNSNDTALGLLPFFHAYGQITSIANIINKITIITYPRFDEDLFLKAIQDYKISQLFIAPPIAVFMAKTPKLEKYDLSSVTHVSCGAAPLSPNIQEEIKRRLKNLKALRQAYGLTESTLAVTMLQVDEDKPGSVGRVAPAMSCMIRDPESGKSLGPNEVGEVCFKGPMNMIGYYRDEKATKETFLSGGWLRSGDLGYYDKDFYFYIVDRLKELIKYKGFQVAPAELEAILLKHQKIIDVGVVGLPDEFCGELPLAFVVKRPGANLTTKEIQDFVAGQVSPQKRLSGGVIFVSSIPKNPSGKILRRELRQMLKNYSNIKSKL